MGINWIANVSGKASRGRSDVEVSYTKGKNAAYRLYFAKGAYATKLKNAERILVGMNDSETRMYFAPAEGALGYKVNATGKNVATVSISARKMEQTFPTLPPSAVIGSYELKLDEAEKLHYISIGALPR